MEENKMPAYTDVQRAVLMTSLHPPTNPILLNKWRNETQDEDLKSLIDMWIRFLEGRIRSGDYIPEYDAVYNKVMADYYNK